jgi:hypothetical protein
MTKRISLALATLAALAALTIAAPGPPDGEGQVGPEIRAKAAGIFEALERVRAERGRPSPDRGAAASSEAGSRSLTFSEAEFNAYVACRLEDEKEPFVRIAEFKLLADDHIEGRIALDLGSKQAAGLLPQRQDLLFAARFESRDGMIRIHMDKLFLGTQPLAPALIDMIIGVVSRLQGVEPTSLEDWYDLPPGVVRLETRPGRVAVFY